MPFLLAFSLLGSLCVLLDKVGHLPTYGKSETEKERYTKRFTNNFMSGKCFFAAVMQMGICQ